MAHCIFCANGKHGRCKKRNKGGCPANCQHRGTKHTLTHPVYSNGAAVTKPTPTPLLISVADHQQEPVHLPAGVSVGAGLLERAAAEKLETLPDTSGTITGVFDSGNPSMEWIGIPKTVLPELIVEYVKRVETDPTEERCKCLWDTVDTPRGRVRVKRSDHPDCSVHTKEGFIKGFFDWAFEDNRATDISLSMEPDEEEPYPGLNDGYRA